MKKLRIYIDTSVIGGCFDNPFKADSLRLFDEIKSDKKIAVISEVFLRELQDAPVFIRDFYDEISKICEVILLDDEIDLLSEQYITSGIVSRKFKNDTLHIAAATVNNVKNGYREVKIYSPKEVINYGV